MGQDSCDRNHLLSVASAKRHLLGHLAADPADGVLAHGSASRPRRSAQPIPPAVSPRAVSRTTIGSETAPYGTMTGLNVPALPLGGGAIPTDRGQSGLNRGPVPAHGVARADGGQGCRGRSSPVITTAAMAATTMDTTRARAATTARSVRGLPSRVRHGVAGLGPGLQRRRTSLHETPLPEGDTMSWSSKEWGAVGAR